MHTLDEFQVPLQRLDERISKRRYPILAALAPANVDTPILEIEILGAQPQALHQAKS
jgi:hypothetical protein